MMGGTSERQCNPQTKYELQTYSYLALRKAVGWTGILLPIALLLGNTLLFGGSFPEPSISLYYHTPMRDVLVGGLCAVALFLFFYAGHNRWDNYTGDLAAFFALIVAWFPASEPGVGGVINAIHFVAAALFFITLACFSLFLFTKSDDNPTPEKLKRNIVYIACGIIMIASMLLMLVYFIITGHSGTSAVIFWAETIALIAFGVSWLTKGGTLYPDKE
jgi:drug/metabolite transporter (DMT)-like permease